MTTCTTHHASAAPPAAAAAQLPAQLPAQLAEQLASLLVQTPASPDTFAPAKLNLNQLARWLKTPQAVELLGSIGDIALVRAKVITANQALRAIFALSKVLDSEIQSPTQAETVRKAASSILRLHERLSRVPLLPPQTPEPGPDPSPCPGPGLTASETTPDRNPNRQPAPPPHIPSQPSSQPGAAQHPAAPNTAVAQETFAQAHARHTPPPSTVRDARGPVNDREFAMPRSYHPIRGSHQTPTRAAPPAATPP